MTAGLIAAFILLLAVQTLVSYVERLYTEMGKFLSREFEENISAFEQVVEPRLGVSRQKAALSFAVLEQMATAGIAIILAYLVFRDPKWTGTELAQAIVVLALAIVVFNRILPFLMFSRTRGEWLSGFSIVLRVLIYCAMPLTLVIAFCTSVAALAREHAEPEPESPQDAVDALIEAGQEEGILEEGDRELGEFILRSGRCLFCGFCAQVCPVDAITMSGEYELATRDRDGLIYTKTELAAIGAQDKTWWDAGSPPPDEHD